MTSGRADARRGLGGGRLRPVQGNRGNRHRRFLGCVEGGFGPSQRRARLSRR